MKTLQHITISSDHTGRRLDHFLFNFWKNVPKSCIYRLIRKGAIQINQKKVPPHYRLKTTDNLALPLLRVSDRTHQPKCPLELQKKLLHRILYEDKYLLVINKPIGLAVHGGSQLHFGLIDILRQARPDLHFIELAHRLDRDTSGCLVIAKKHSILRALHELLREGKVTKIYHALTMGHWPKSLHTIEAPLQKNCTRSGERLVKIHASGKLAVTQFRVIHHFQTASLVEIQLKTGRTHQIRVHTQYAQHPIAMDFKYGNNIFNQSMKALGLNRLFLHASHIKFHLKGNPIHVYAPMDSELSIVLKKLDDKNPL